MTSRQDDCDSPVTRRGKHNKLYHFKSRFLDNRVLERFLFDTQNPAVRIIPGAYIPNGLGTDCCKCAPPIVSGLVGMDPVQWLD